MFSVQTNFSMYQYKIERIYSYHAETTNNLLNVKTFSNVEIVSNYSAVMLIGASDGTVDCKCLIAGEFKEEI